MARHHAWLVAALAIALVAAPVAAAAAEAAATKGAWCSGRARGAMRGVGRGAPIRRRAGAAVAAAAPSPTPRPPVPPPLPSSHTHKTAPVNAPVVAAGDKNVAAPVVAAAKNVPVAAAAAKNAAAPVATATAAATPVVATPVAAAAAKAAAPVATTTPVTVAPVAATAAPAKNAVAAAAPAKNAAAPVPAAKPQQPTLFASIAARPELSSFAAALRLIGAADELDQPNARTAVFAPSNAAMDAFARELLGDAKATAAESLLSPAAGPRYAPLLRRLAAASAGVAAPGAGAPVVFLTYGGQQLKVSKVANNKNAASARPMVVAMSEATPAAPTTPTLTTTTLLAADLGDNGAIYVVDRVLKPADVLVAATPSNTKAPAEAKQPQQPQQSQKLALLAADADVSSFARLAELLLSPEALSASSPPLNVFAPRNAAINAYLDRAHGFKSVEEAEGALSSLPVAASMVEKMAATGDKTASEGAQKQLQRLLALRSDLTAVVAYHVSPSLALDAATLSEGGRTLPTLLAVGAGGDKAAGAAIPPATSPNAAAPVRMLGVKAGAGGVMLSDAESAPAAGAQASAKILGTWMAGDDALHKLDAVLAVAPQPLDEAAMLAMVGKLVEGGDGDVAVVAADGLMTEGVKGVDGSASATTTPSGARGWDITIRNQIIQNSIQSNIHRALTGGMTVQQAALYNSALANLAPYGQVPLYYLMPPRGGGSYSYSGSYGGSGYGGGYWLG